MANALILKPAPFVVMRADARANYAADNLANDYAGVLWASPPADAATLVFDMGFDQPINTIMLFGLWGNFSSASARYNILLATDAEGPGFNAAPHDAGGSGPGSYWTVRDQPMFAGDALIKPGNGVLLWSAPADVPPVSRYVLIYFHGLSSEGYVQASRAVITAPIQLDRNFTFGGTFGVRDLGSVDFSRLGVMQRKRGAKLRTCSLTFTSIHRDEVENVVQPLLEEIGNTEMVALVTDPSPHPNRQKRCYFGPLVGDLGTTWRRADGFQAVTNIVSIF